MTDAIPQTVVLLGASNLRLGLRTVVQSVGEAVGGPLRILTACGHGRSYGQWSSIPFRALPGIVECGLWSDLNAGRSNHSPYALITDVGNDLLYGADVPTLLQWVERCLEPLSRRSAHILITLPPLKILEALSPARFLFFRSLLFPRSPLTREQMRDAVIGLSEGLSQLAVKHSARVIAPRAEWYGFDPIHIRRRYRRRAWTSIFDHWRPPHSRHSEIAAAPRFPRPGVSLRWKAPKRRRILGFEQIAPQPAACSNHWTISLY